MRVFALFLLISLFYFHKTLWGQLPIPSDLLVGGYYPWHDYNWGYPTGVPIKNPSISDVISQLYPWKLAVMDVFKNGQIPLWNPYVSSGMPLLANLQSAPLYPLNLFMLLLGTAYGWTLIVILQILLSLTFMYLFLKELGLKDLSSVFGSIIFTFSGFMTTYLQFLTIGQVFLWLPLLLLLTYRYFKSQKYKYLLATPTIIFCILTAGHFQAALYLFVIWGFFIIFNFHPPFKPRRIITILGVFSLSLGLCAIQLFPTFELFNLSIRQSDYNISHYNYGLIPWRNLITLISPDFFGHPSTYNFWGIIGYQETSGYFGVIPIILATTYLLFIKKTRDSFLILCAFLFLLSLALIIDSPFSRLFYQLKIPILSTSYATRLFLIFNFAASLLATASLNKLSENKKGVFYVTTLFLISLSFLELYLYSNKATSVNFSVAFRNTLLPLGITIIFLTAQILLKDTKKVVMVVVALTIFDLLRFSLKFNTFSDIKILYPQTPTIDFLQKNTGSYRIDREKSEVLPPNSWSSYKLMSPSGYDPLIFKNYAYFYSLYNNTSPKGGVSRYEELENPHSPFIDLAGVKYLVVAKREDSGRINTSSSSSILKNPKFKQVFEDKSVIILENKNVLPRVMLLNNYSVEKDNLEALDKIYKGADYRNSVILNSFPKNQNFAVEQGDNADITSYQTNEVTITSNTKNISLLMLTDTNYPGWKVKIDGQEKPILTANGIFRAVELPAGNHEVKFFYDPFSFKLGLIISLSSFFLLIIFAILYKKI